MLAARLGLLPAIDGAADEKPTDSEIGVTAKEIHIATVADVDNSFAPGLFQGGVDGVEAGGEVHQRQRRASAGRKLVLDFIDSHLNPNDARNGFITACENDVAMVGNGDVPDRQLRRCRQLRGQGGSGHRPPRHAVDVDQLEAGVFTGDVCTVRQPARLLHGQPRIRRRSPVRPATRSTT